MVSERYEYGVDFDRIDAIDIHTHVEVDCHGHKAY
ncbi:4-hydroxyphenyl-beta-ketoacyl-CoA hydrolase, partial [Mycolicibacterium elephantis]